MVVRAEKIEFIFLHLISIAHCTQCTLYSSWGLHCFLGVGGKNQRGWSPVNTFDNSEAKNTTYFTYPRMTAAIGKKIFFFPVSFKYWVNKKDLCVFNLNLL